jgi:hypothetical protein
MPEAEYRPPETAEASSRGTACSTAHVIRGLTEDLLDTVITPIDKNAGDSWIECRQLAWDRYDKYYRDQPKTYEVCTDLTEDDVRRAMRREYKAAGLTAVAPWDSSGQFGKAQLLPKHKDPFEKVRPVTPMHKAYTRKASNRAARALNALVERRFAGVDWVLWRTFELKDKIARVQARLRALGPTWRAIGESCDATGMFTNLPHDGPDGAHAFLDDMEQWCADNGIATLWIRRRGRSGVVFDKNSDTGAYAQISVALIFTQLRFDIKWLYFTLGDQLLKQLFGFPMGMPSSHPLSVGICAWSEAKFSQTLGTDGRYLSVTRYVDDVLAIAFYDSAVGGPEQGQRLIDDMRAKAYSPELTLLTTSDDNHAVDFMDTVTDIDDETQTITLQQLDKNSRHLLSGAGRVIVRYQHFHTYAPTKQLQGVVVSQLRRIRRNCTTDADALRHMVAYGDEIRALRYPTSMMARASLTCQRRQPESLLWWRLRWFQQTYE